MSSTTVAEFANELKKSTDQLLEQLKSAGVAKSAPTDALSDADKQKLLGYLQASHGTATPEARICAFWPFSTCGPSASRYMPASKPWTSRFSGSAGWFIGSL